MTTDDKTQMMDDTTTRSETTRIQNGNSRRHRTNPAAPVSREAVEKSPWGKRLAIGGAGLAGALGIGVAAASFSTKGTKLTPTTTPSPEDDTPGNKVDHNFQGEHDLPNTVVPEEPSDENYEPVYEETSEEPTTSVNDEITDDNSEQDIEPDSDKVEATENATDDSIVESHQEMTQPDEVLISTHPTPNVPPKTDEPSMIIDQNTEISDTESNIAEPVNEIENNSPVNPEYIETVDIEVETPESGMEITGVPMAEVNDSMSFGEAFATARAQVGAPGVFVWHGNTYGTYYAEEWNNMTMEERGNFTRAVSFPNDVTDDSFALTDSIEDPDYYTVDTDEYTPDMKIQSITQTIDSDGNVTTQAHVTIDGIDTHFVDIDGDGTMDAVYVDIDGDGEFVEGVDAVIPVGDAGIRVEDMIDAVYTQNMTGDDDMPQEFHDEEYVTATQYDNDGMLNQDMLMDMGDDMASMDFTPDAAADF